MPEDENGKHISASEYRARWIAGVDPASIRKKRAEEAADLAAEKAQQREKIEREIGELKATGIPRAHPIPGSNMDVGESKANTADQIQECSHRLSEISHTKEELSTSIGITANISESTDSETAAKVVALLAEATRELEEAYTHVSEAKEELEELLLKLNRL